MKCIITGHTRGLGLAFYNHFVSKGYDVTGFSQSNGYDLVSGYREIVTKSAGCDLFINNSYANGMQLHLLNALYCRVGKMIVCGSVASENPDPLLPAYSIHKKLLADRVRDIQVGKLNNQADILMLRLSGEAVNNPSTVLTLVDFWLDNPMVVEFGFDPSGKPNR